MRARGIVVRAKIIGVGAKGNRGESVLLVVSNRDFTHTHKHTHTHTRTRARALGHLEPRNGSVVKSGNDFHDRVKVAEFAGMARHVDKELHCPCPLIVLFRVNHRGGNLDGGV